MRRTKVSPWSGPGLDRPVPTCAAGANGRGLVSLFVPLLRALGRLADGLHTLVLLGVNVCAVEGELRNPAMAKVMVVDDAYSDLQVMESILRSAGHEVISYLDGEHLEDRIVADQPDVVLLDIVMPKRNGFDALRGLRRDARTRETPVVVVSSKNQESDRTWGLRQGADEYLGKPFTAEQLLGMVRRFIR